MYSPTHANSSFSGTCCRALEATQRVKWPGCWLYEVHVKEPDHVSRVGWPARPRPCYLPIIKHVGGWGGWKIDGGSRAPPGQHTHTSGEAGLAFSVHVPCVTWVKSEWNWPHSVWFQFIRLPVLLQWWKIDFWTAGMQIIAEVTVYPSDVKVYNRINLLWAAYLNKTNIWDLGDKEQKRIEQ